MRPAAVRRESRRADYGSIAVVLLIAGMFAFILFSTGSLQKSSAPATGGERSIPSAPEAASPTGAVIGCQEWTVKKDIRANEWLYDVATDPAGGVYSVGRIWRPNTMFLTKVNPADGNTIWAHEYMYPHPDAAWTEGYSLVADSSNVYVTGNVGFLDKNKFGVSDTETFIQQLDLNGNIMWSDMLTNRGNTFYDNGYGIAVDQQKNIYVTGTKGVIGANNQVVFFIHVVKIHHRDNQNQPLALAWSKTFKGDTPGSGNLGYDIALEDRTHILLGKDPYLVVVGKVVNKIGPNTKGYDPDGFQEDMLVQKMRLSDGAVLWTKIFKGDQEAFNPGGHNAGKSVALDKFGDIYITGYERFMKVVPQHEEEMIDNKTGLPIIDDKTGLPKKIIVPERTLNDDDLVIMKLNPAGDVRWKKIIDISREVNDQGMSIAVDDALNIYVRAADPSNAYTLRFNPGGAELWRRTFEKAGGDNNGYFAGIALDKNVPIAAVNLPDIYVSGAVQVPFDPNINPPNYYDFWMQKYCNK